MNTEKRSEKFFTFLEREGAKEKFMANIANGDIHGFPELVKPDGTFDFDRYGSWGPAGGFISGAFRWDESPEGDDYWRGLSTKWREEIA